LCVFVRRFIPLPSMKLIPLYRLTSLQTFMKHWNHVCSVVALASPQYWKDMGLILGIRESYGNQWTTTNRHSFNSYRRNPWTTMAASILYLSYCSWSPLLTVYLKHPRLYRFANLRSHEVSGTELMTESYCELFSRLLLEYNTGRRWWYLLDSDETDDSSLANLFGIKTEA
jgi:hypothetical protein